MLRGIWGFYGDHKPHGDKLFQFARRVPLTTIIVDTPQSIARSFDIVDELTTRHGLVTSEMVPAACRSMRPSGSVTSRWHSTTTDRASAPLALPEHRDVVGRADQRIQGHPSI